MNKQPSQISVVMSVYKNDSPEDFIIATRSILDQTIPPQEIIVVIDGPIGMDLEESIQKISQENSIKIIRLEENKGLAVARKTAIEQAKHNIIAVMDSDDISVLDRFESQLPYIVKEGFDLVGGWIEEFVNNPNDTGKVRKVPENIAEIYKFGKWRAPVNHVTIMFKKDSYNSIGGYSDVRNSEDWDLLSRMLVNGYKIKNIPEVLVNVRAGDELIERRRKIPQFKAEIRLFFRMYKLKYIGVFHLISNIIIRISLRVLPKFFTSLTYRHALREKL